jgi:hypothetical protein
MNNILNFSNFLQLKNNDLSDYKTYCFSDFSKMYETHHRLDGEQSLEKISNDIAEFIRYQFKHPSGRKKKLYDAKKTELITKDTHKVVSRKLQKDMSEYINKFREEMGNVYSEGSNYEEHCC